MNHSVFASQENRNRVRNALFPLTIDLRSWWAICEIRANRTTVRLLVGAGRLSRFVVSSGKAREEGGDSVSGCKGAVDERG